MATIWHPLPGRLQSVSVADKNNIWGVTLDFQLCKLNSKTQQWQLVSVTSESVNHVRFSSSSAQSLQSAASTSSFSAAKKLSALLPSLGRTSSTPSTPVVTRSATIRSTTGFTQQQTIGVTSNKSIPNSPSMTRANSSSSLLAADTEEDTTFQVSAASDGTVVRLDRSLKAWYLIAPHNDNVDYEKDVIWIDLGHFWKCVSVASISQIWGLSDYGDIYYGTTDRFALLEHAITSGAGYNKPAFTHISVGHDNLVVATDAHSGTVFRLKLHPTGACPPVWNALPGTGPGSRLHIVNCSLSTADFIVGVAKDGRVYRYSRSVWTPLGGGAKLENVGVGIDGYVLGVDRDGDLFGCQLESTAMVIPPIPLDRPSSREWTHKAVKDDESSAPSSPQAPNGPSLFNTPRQQSMSKRPTSSPRELFEMAASFSLARSSTTPIGETKMGASRITRTSSPLRESGGAGGAGGVAGPGNGSSWAGSRAYTYSKTSGLNRTDSQMSKRSYASDIGTPKTPTGLSLSRPSTPTLSQDPDSDLAISSSAEQKAPIQAAAAAALPVSIPSPHPRVTPLRILTKGMFSSSPAPLSTDQGGESYFTSKPITTYGPLSNLSPLTSFPLDGNPYATGSKPSSDTSNVQTPITPHSDGNNNFTLSDSSKSSGSFNNLLNFPGQQNANSQDAIEDELQEDVQEEKREEENHPSIGNGPNPPLSSSSISPSVSALNRVPSGVAMGFVQQFEGHRQHPVLEERIQQRQPNNAMVESGQVLNLLPNANGSINAVETVEMAKRENECRDIHSIDPLDPLSPLTAVAVASATEIDPRQPFPLPPPATTQPAVVNAVVPSGPRQRMELNRLLSSDKSEWLENGAHGHGGSEPDDRNNYNYSNMTNGVIIAGPEGQRNNDDDEHVWNGDTALLQPNLDQDKRDPSMAFSHLEQQQPSPSSVSSSTTPARVPLQSPLSRNLAHFSPEQQQQQSRLETVPQDYYKPTPPFLGNYDTYNSNNYSSSNNNNNNDITTTNGQPRTASFLPWDNKQELNEPSSLLAVPQSGRQFYSDLRQQEQQQEPDFGLEPPRQDLLSQHRPSDSSEVLMLQQQEYLRRTRLRSQPSSVVIANDPALAALSEKTEVLQDHHPLSDKTEIDYHHFGDNSSNNQFQKQQSQQSQQQQRSQFQHFPPPAARRLSEEYYQHFPFPAVRRPSEEYYHNNSASQPNEEEDDEMLRFRQKKKELPPDGRRNSKFYPESPIPQEFVDALNRSRSGASASVNNAGIGSSNNNSRRNSSRNNNDNNAFEAPSHPSYSSTHLQKYVNTTMQQPHSHPPSGRSSVQSINLTPTNGVAGGYNFNTGPGSGSGSGSRSGSGSGSFNAKGRNPYRQGSGSNGINHNNRTTTTVGSSNNGVAPSMRSGGITGEDAQGRWVGSPTGADNRVTTFGTSDVHKGRCCIIL